MSKLTKNQKAVADKVEAGKEYTLAEASQLVKDITFTKFDASLDIDIRLGVDPRKANQMVRGVVSLPNGTGKEVRVLALVTSDQAAAATEAGADYVGLEEYIDKIKGGWTDIDVIITMPSCMGGQDRYRSRFYRQGFFLCREDCAERSGVHQHDHQAQACYSEGYLHQEHLSFKYYE